MLKKIISLLFQSKSNSLSSQPPRGGNGHVGPNGLASSQLPHGNQRLPIVNHKAGESVRPMSRDVRTGCSPKESRSAKELLRDGQLQIAIIGFNAYAFPMKEWTASDAPELVNRIKELPHRIKMGTREERNAAAAMNKGLNLLDTCPDGRRGLILLTAGDPNFKPAWATELATLAARDGIGVHVVHVGDTAADLTILPGLASKQTLRYGSFRTAATAEEVTEAVRGSFDGLVPARAMRGRNSAVILVDASRKMLEPFGGSTRVEMITVGLKEFLRSPLQLPKERRLALAA